MLNMIYNVSMTIANLSPIERKLVHALANAMMVMEDAPRCADTIRALCEGQNVLAAMYGCEDRPWDVDVKFIREITKEAV